MKCPECNYEMNGPTHDFWGWSCAECGNSVPLYPNISPDMNADKTNSEILQELFGDEDQPLSVMDGYDDCIVGVVEQFGHALIICYDKTAVLKKLEAEGMSAEEASEWFYFNQVGAYVGETTPCFLTRLPNAQVSDAKRSLD
jgi:hypothetical protein